MPNQSWKYRANIFFSSAFVKPFLCVGVLFIIDSTFSGPFLTYMIDILDETGSDIDPDLVLRLRPDLHQPVGLLVIHVGY